MLTVFENKSLEQRVSESRRLKCKYPDRIPIIIDSKDPEIKKALEKNKFLVPWNLPVSTFLYVVRKKLNINYSEALFLFTSDNVLLAGANTVSEAYDKYRLRKNIKLDSDTFFYMTLSKENTFG